MRAFCGQELGDVANFALAQVSAPQPGPRALRVRIEATALGFVDQLVMRGLYQQKPALPFVPGGEIVGIVEAVGEGVSDFTPGQRIAAWQFSGGLADQASVKAIHTVPVPEDLPSPKAAAVLLDYLTAYYGLFDRGSLAPGQTVLVTGASGGVGSAAVAIASAASARVIGLASTPEKQALVRRLGAEMVIDYRDGDWRDQLKRAFPQGVDRVFDPVGGSLFQQCFRSLAKHGQHLVVGFASGDGIPTLPANLPLLKSGALVGVDARYLWESDPTRVRTILGILLNLAAQGKIDPPIAQVIKLDDVAKAFALLEDPDRIGKIVVVP